MSAIKLLSSSLARKDQIPNKKLAEKICSTNNVEFVREIIENLYNSDKHVQSDCIAVLEYIGQSKPKLISSYVTEFLDLLPSKNNRMVWGGMIVLSTIALIESKTIFENIEIVLKSIEKGSVITVDNGISVLARVASVNELYENRIIPILLNHLKNCRPKEVGQHAEKSIVAISDRNRPEFGKVLSKRLDDLSSSQEKRVKKVLSMIEKI